jgi:hypothetical protein
MPQPVKKRNLKNQKFFNQVKKLFFIVSLVALVAAGTLFAYHAATGSAEAEKFGTVAVLSFASLGLAVMPRTTYSLGLQMSRAEETLLDFLKRKSDPNVFAKYNAGQLRFRDYNIYRAIQVDGLNGIQKIWDTTVAKSTGITNVDYGKLEKDVHMCVDRILIQYVNTGGAGTDPKAVAAFDGVVTGWPAGLANAELYIDQDNNPLISQLPVALCGSQADSQTAVGYWDAYRLTTPFVLEGDKPFEVRIDFPAALSASNTEFLKIMLLGVATRKRGLV